MTLLQKIKAYIKGNCTTCGSVKVGRGFRGIRECRNRDCKDKDNYWIKFS